MSTRSSEDLLGLDSEKQKRMSGTSQTSSNDSQRKVKLFVSPLAHIRKTSSPGFPPPEPKFIDISGPTHLAAPYNPRQKILEEARNGAYGSQNAERLDEVQMRETPSFRRYEEATNLELFYDLFFVANLTTFTDTHEINQTSALKAYAGFFCMLWFLWLQVSLFDVRFGQDSVLERIGKSLRRLPNPRISQKSKAKCPFCRIWSDGPPSYVRLGF